jgi:hypothetical protein
MRLEDYVEWHMRGARRELMFAVPDQNAKKSRDHVAPAKRSQAAENKVTSRHLDDGTPAHSFSTLFAELGTIVRAKRSGMQRRLRPQKRKSLAFRGDWFVSLPYYPNFRTVGFWLNL